MNKLKNIFRFWLPVAIVVAAFSALATSLCNSRNGKLPTIRKSRWRKIQRRHWTAVQPSIGHTEITSRNVNQPGAFYCPV